MISLNPTLRPPSEEMTLEQQYAASQNLIANALATAEMLLHNRPEDLTLNQWVLLISEFDKQKFGHIPITGTMLKLVKEMAELLDNPKDGSEYGDVIILICSIARRSGLFNLARPLAEKFIEIRPQQFIMQPDGTGNRVKENTDGKR